MSAGSFSRASAGRARKSTKQSERKTLAVLMVVVMVAAVALPLASVWGPNSDSNGYSGSSHKVQYNSMYDGYFLNSSAKDDHDLVPHSKNNTQTGKDATGSGTFTNQMLTREYQGSFVSTEYNPQAWGYDKWYDITYKIPDSGDNGYVANIQQENAPIVFTGWAYAIYNNGNLTGYTEPRFPGEVMSEAEMAAATDPEGTIQIFATWGYLKNLGTWVAHRSNFVEGDVYTNIVFMRSTATLANISNVEMTIRGISNAAIARPAEGTNGECKLSANLIIDNIPISGSHTSNHGDGVGGIMANGHVLIIGFGVTAKGDDEDNPNLRSHYTQIFGGSSTAVTSAAAIRTPYGGNGETSFGAFVIIHSGTFANVVAGSRNQNIGTATEGLSTYLVLRDVTVLDTVIGGNGGGNSSNNAIHGSAYTYAQGLKMYGDYYQESTLHSPSSDTSYKNPLKVQLTESTIFTGGSNNGTITGDTKVYISGDSELWDVQAGGRRGSSQVQTANLEISGNTLIKHVACGSITDGNDSYRNVRSVVNSSIVVKDGAMVGSVFGAGYDTYYSTTYASMYGSGSSISIDIQGGTVGYVYGGGYRGSIGYDNDGNEDPIDSITINISGGEVLNDVFGGGRGGVDKPLHDTDGNLNSSGQTGLRDSTGLSKVCVGTITINITGGTVWRHVVGGGESVPIVNGYRAGPTGNAKDVAEVVADAININAGDCKIVGRIAGGGMGIDVDETTDLPGTYVMTANGKVQRIPWYAGSDGELKYNTTADYSGFAKVNAGDISIRFVDYRATEDTDADLSRWGSVYGGGLYAQTEVSDEISIYIHNATLAECVYGGGMGVENGTWQGEVTARLVSMVFDGDDSGLGTIIGQRASASSYAVFCGGQNAFMKADLAYVILQGNTDIRGDVHGGGLGTLGTPVMDASRAVVINGATVNGNIFGGSRFGMDAPEGCVTTTTVENDDGSTTTSSTVTVEQSDFTQSVVLVIGGTVTQSVYGGGFEGQSYMDSFVRVGTPAIELMEAYLGADTLDYTRSKHIHIGSVYGGSNLGDFTAEAFSDKSALLMGDAQMEIALDISAYPDYAETSDFIRIEGDIFGEGNYSALHKDKRAIVWIHDYLMPDGRSVMSIQRCDELYIVDSRLNLSGSTDGGITGQTERYSLVRIGHLQLDRTTLDLYSQTAFITDYYSMVDGVLATPEQCVKTSGSLTGNEIVIHGGVPFTLVNSEGGDNQSAILSVGRVHGYTLLSKPDDDAYYGAYALGTKDPAEHTGFMVNDGAEEASVMLRENANNSGIDIYTWYLSGHFTLNEQIVYTIGEPDPHSFTLQLPRLGSGSNTSSPTTYRYIGSYVNPAVQNGMYVVTGDDYTNSESDDNQGVTFIDLTMTGRTSSTAGGTTTYSETKTAVKTHSWAEGAWTRDTVGSAVNVANSSYMTVSTSLLSSGPEQSVGRLGEVVINLCEAVRTGEGDSAQYIPINMIDVIVSVYVEPKAPVPPENVVDIFVTVMATSNGNGTHSGRGYINLPAGPGEPMVYTITDANDVGSDEVYLWSDRTHLGLSGWTVIRYSEDYQYRLQDTKGTFTGDVFGEGGVRSTSIALDYTGTLGTDGTKTFRITITDDSSGTDSSGESTDPVTYRITVNVREAVNVDLDVSYQSFDVPKKPETPYPLMHLDVTGNGTSSNPFRLTWVEDGVPYTPMSIPYGTVLSTDTFFYYVGENTTAETTLERILELSLDAQPLLVTDDSARDSYLDYLHGWYMDAEGLTRYNTGSQATEDTRIYAGFGVTVTFHGQGVTVYPQSITLDPGENLDKYINNIGKSNPDKISVYAGGVDGRPGYHLMGVEQTGSDTKVYGWMYEGSNGWELFSLYTGLYQDLDLYLVWDPNEYVITITSSPDGETVTVEVDGEKVPLTDYKFKAPYGSSITITCADGSIIQDATVSWNWDVTENKWMSSLTPSGLDTPTVGFTVPDAGADGSPISVDLTVATGHTLYVDYTSSPYDMVSVEDEMTVTMTVDGGDPYTKTLTYSEREVTFPLTGKGDSKTYTLTFEFTGGGSNTGVEMWWTFQIGTQQDDGTYAFSDSMEGIENTRGKTTRGYTISDPSGDVHLRLEMHKRVDLMHVGAGIASVTADGIEVYPRTLDYETSVDLADGECPLFAGEILRIKPASGYYLPPNNTQGITAQNDGSYIVRGDYDVRIGYLQTTVVDVVVYLTFKDGDTTVSPKVDLGYTVVINSHRTAGTWKDSDNGPVTATNVPLSQSGYNVAISFEGFENLTVNIPSDAAYETDGNGKRTYEVKATLQIIHYTVHYHDTSGAPITADEGSLTDWTVASGASAPVCYVDGEPATAHAAVDPATQLWYMGVLNQSQTGYEASADFCTELTLGSFNNRAVHLFALEKPTGGYEVATGTTVHLLVQQGHVNDVHHIGGGLFDNWAVFTHRWTEDSGEMGACVYNSTQGTITIKGVPEGTGSFVLIHERGDGATDLVVVHVFVDPESVVDGVVSQ